MHYIMYLIHSCSFVICSLWWWYLPNDWTLTDALYFKKKSSLNILCRTVGSSMWEVFAIHSWYLCSVVICIMHCCVCLQRFVLKNGTLCIFQFSRAPTDIYYPYSDVVSGLWTIYCSQNKIMYQKQKMDVLPSSHLLRSKFKVIHMVFVLGKMALGQEFLWVH